MSYSFSAKGNTKKDAAAAVADQMAQVVHGQPVHAKDQNAVEQAAAALIDVLQDDDTQEVLVSVNGYVSWGDATRDDDHPIKTVSTTITAHLQAKAVQAAAAASTTEGGEGGGPGGSDQGGA